MWRATPITTFFLKWVDPEMQKWSVKSCTCFLHFSFKNSRCWSNYASKYWFNLQVFWRFLIKFTVVLLCILSQCAEYKVYYLWHTSKKVNFEIKNVDTYGRKNKENSKKLSWVSPLIIKNGVCTSVENEIDSLVEMKLVRQLVLKLR